MSTSTNGEYKKSLSLRMEEFGPLLLAMGTLAIVMVLAPDISEKFSSNEWNSSGLYQSIFGWSAIQIGFAFAVYGFVLGKSGGFIDKIRGTLALSRFISYIKNANWAGFVLTITSMPLIVADPKMPIGMSWTYFAVAVWFSLFIWSFFSFLRLSYNFGHLVSIKDKVSHGA